MFKGNILKIKLPPKLLVETAKYTVRRKTWITALTGVSAMEAFFRMAPKINLPRIDNATMNGTIFLPPGRKASILGTSMFYAGAVAWVSLYRTLVPRIKGTPTIKALKFGTGLFLFASFIVMPSMRLINPRMRKGQIKKPGILGLKLAGWKTVVSNFLGHIIFSLVITRKNAS